MVKLANFPVDPEATAVAIAYRNPDFALIGDDVMPRCTPVSTREFSYLRYPVGTFFTAPDDTLGPTGVANEVKTSAAKETGSAEDHGLKIKISQKDIEDAKKNGLNPVNEAVSDIMYFVTLNREIRVAGLAGNAANYSPDNVITLSGTDMWSDAANSDPLEQLLGIIDGPLMRPNVMTLSLPGWTKLRTNPQAIKAIKGALGEGALTKKQVADYLEIEELLVGATRVNAARKGQDLNLQPCWGNFCALHYRSKQANTKRGITWGMTVPKGRRIAGSWPEKEIGLEGGIVTVAGEIVGEVVVGAECGALIQNLF